MKISELLDDVRKQNLVLPEFQREYVWRKEQAKQLIVSLFKGFPVGGVLFWKTKAPPQLKNVDELPETLGTVQVILDGQQRITTIYMLVTGEIPPFYRESDIENDPRDLYFNLATGEFQYYQVSKMKGDALWQRVVDCFIQKEINVFEIAKGAAESDSAAFELASSYNDNLNGLRNIGVVDLPEQVVPTHASLGEAIDIFDRVNSLGTKLTDAELALTHVTGKWADARRRMKEKIRKLDQKSFYFDLTFTTRALTGVVCRRALFETLHDRPLEEVVQGWERASRILDYLVSVLPARAAIHSTEDLNSKNTLIPLVVYLNLNGGKFPNEKAIHHAIHWLYAAHTWSRYTAQTDQRLEHDVTIMVREESPWESLCAQIVDQRGRLEVKAADFEGRGALHPLYRMLFILAKTHQATDWFNGLPLGTTHGKRYRLHSHHIFPQSLLYKELYDVSSHLDRKKVNEVANRAFLTADTNQELSNRRPEDYLPEVLAKFPDALARQFIPTDPGLWRLERYEDFLAARRELIARKLNEYMRGLIVEPEEIRERPLEETVTLGEGPTLEFKSTLEWDVVQNQRNKHLRKSVLKTIAAFLNSNGGRLLIGVDDSGGVYGLEADLGLLGKSHDRFLQHLHSLIASAIGPQYAPLIRADLRPLNGQQVCVVDVERAGEPVFMTEDGGKVFYIRVGNASRALDAAEAVSYIEQAWQ